MARRKKTTEEPTPDNSSSSMSDDNFGLPDIDYRPLDRTEPEPQPEPTPVIETPVAEKSPYSYDSSSSYSSSYPESNEGTSLLPRILGIVFVLGLVLGATWYFAVYKPNQAAKEKAALEQKQKEAEERERQRLEDQARLEEERRRAEEAANAKPAEGTIETLAERTKRYYVVVASSIDADLVMDYAKKLSAKGVTCKIIPPYGKIKFSRLTVAEGDTFAAAQTTADGLKAEYGDALWVIKY